MLREKSEMLAMLGQKTIYIMANSRFGKKSLLQLSLDMKWKSDPFHGNIIVMMRDEVQVNKPLSQIITLLYCGPNNKL